MYGVASKPNVDGASIRWWWPVSTSALLITNGLQITLTKPGDLIWIIVSVGEMIDRSRLLEIAEWLLTG
jgi:hypothetical protein